MKYGKYILPFFIFLFISSSLYSQQYWLDMPSPVNLDLRKSCFLDTLNGWVAGDSGLIIKTSNGGLNWSRQNSKTRLPVYEIFFLNSRLGWALAWNLFDPLLPFGTLILKTTDGGINWDTSTFKTQNAFLPAIYFQDSLYGFMGGNLRNIMRTTDGGADWLDCAIDTISVSFLPVMSFTFLNNDYGYASGGHQDFAGLIWRTTNRGVRWIPTVVAPEPVNNVVFLDSLRIIGVSGDVENGPGSISSLNSGLSWKYNYLGYFGRSGLIAFRNKNEVWAPLASALSFIYSLDTGKSWNIYPNPDSVDVNHVIFPDSKHGFAFCMRGRILKYNAALIGINNLNTYIIEDYKLNQNYPNPFNPSTNISYELKNYSYVILKIYDISGREIRTLIDGYQDGGKHYLNFNGSTISSGIYFYEIQIRDLSNKSEKLFKETKKMLLVK
ncbi:MAG: T9SS type A sorting domain-containing protein [Ignavibacteria bacterium]|nr:T9SS type A sorting domain-containing protein [Ignavibacteria bacterium]